MVPEVNFFRLFSRGTCFFIWMAKMKNLEMAIKSFLGKPSLKSPQPPFRKGGQGGFLAGQWSQGKSRQLVLILPTWQ
jgi:hypothetical protein